MQNTNSKKNQISGFLILLLLCLISSCKNDSIITSNVTDPNNATTIPGMLKNNSSPSVDWTMVAIADGGGAALGADLASQSYNFYIIVASAIGVGAYASYKEYERQKEALEDAEDNPDELAENANYINPYLPNYNWIDPELYLVNDMNNVGPMHNALVSDLLQFDLDSENTPNVIINEISNISDMDTTGLTDIMNNLAENSYDYLTDSVNPYYYLIVEYNRYIKSHTLMEIHDYTEELIANIQDETANDNQTKALFFITTTYYSLLFWRPIITNPLLAREAIIVSGTDSHYTTSCSEIDYRMTDENMTILYPIYWHDNLIGFSFSNDVAAHHPDGIFTVDYDISFTPQCIDDEAYIYSGNYIIYSQFRERLQDEIAQVRARMGERQLRLVELHSAEVDEVEVDRARPVAHRAHAPEGVLDRMHPPREVMDLERRLEDGRLVEEPHLRKFRRHVHRLRLDDGARRREPRPGQRRQRRERALQMLRPRPDVRSERDDGPHVRGLPWRSSRARRRQCASRCAS